MAPNDNQPEPMVETAPAPAPGGATQMLTILRWPLAFVMVALIGYLAYRDTLRQTAGAARKTADAVSSVIQGVLSGNVTETFLSSIPEFDEDGSGNLELATLTATETFTRSDERKVLWDHVSLGVATSEIRVPVTYRYHLRLKDAWHLEIEGTVCYVVAPAIRPSLPPAIHTDRMEKRSESDWFRFDEDEQMADLERSITPQLQRYAVDERHLGLVRENARRAVEDFVKTWLLREQQWGADRVRAVHVVFPDEDVEDLGDVPLEILRAEGKD